MEDFFRSLDSRQQLTAQTRFNTPSSTFKLQLVLDYLQQVTHPHDHIYIFKIQPSKSAIYITKQCYFRNHIIELLKTVLTAH